MQTCLEKQGIDARHNAINRNDYDINDKYSDKHADAISDGDVQGKGTKSGGHGHYTPDCSLPHTLYNYSNFDTHNAGGGLYDIKGNPSYNSGREYLMNISVYNSSNPYGSTLVDTTINRQDGQIVV